MVRPQCCDKLNFKKKSWGREEEGQIFEHVPKNAMANGTSITRKTGMKRSAKGGGARWSSSVRPELSNESFTQQEEELIIKLHAAVGSRWGIIAHQLSGRTENDIKIHWNTKLKKKLFERGIDHVTHKPFSQIFADYGKIGGGHSRVVTGGGGGGGRYMGTIKKDLKKVTSFTPPKTEHPSSPSYNCIISNPHLSPNFSQFQSNFTNLSNNNNNEINQSSHSIDLLSQLQSITLVTETSNSDNKLPPQELIHIPFSNNSSNNIASFESCLTYNSGQLVQTPESNSWHDFLLDDHVVKPAHHQELEHQFDDDIGLCFDSSSQFPMPNAGIGEIWFYQTASSSSTTTTTSLQGSSFLEAMLDQENDMFLSFPGLMEEPLY